MHDASVTPAEIGSPSLTVERDALGVELAVEGFRGQERWSFLRRLLLSADLTAASVAGMVGAGLGGMSFEALMTFTALVVVAWPAMSFVCGLYSAEDLRSWASGAAEAPRNLFAAFAVSWPLYGAGILLDAPHPGTGALVAASGCLLLGAPARGLARAVAHQAEPLRQRTVIVGSGMVAGQVAEKLIAHPEFGLRPIGIVDDEVHDLGHPDLPTLGRLDQLSEVLARRSVDRVIIAFSRASHDQLLDSLRACRDRHVAVDVVPRLFEFLNGAHALDQLGGLPLLSVGAPRFSRPARIAKRGLDLAVSGLALAGLAPVFGLLALAIKAESGGPVFFRQPRAGRAGEVFSMLKFRSMHAEADVSTPERRTAGVIVKGGSDPRITRVGKLLRRFSLDELPQLANVIRGDMSLVGPRPLVLSEADALDQRWHERRLDLRPGMTGLWQVSGRSRIPFHEMLRFDYQYVAGWSLARDVEILLQTIPAVLSGRGAY